MLPDFPDIKNKFIEFTYQYLNELLEQDPLFSRLKKETHLEGCGMSSKPANSEIEKSHYKKIIEQEAIMRKDVIAKGPEVYIDALHNMADKMKQEQANILFNKIKEVTNKTGNVVHGNGQGFNFEIYLQALEKIEIHFDDQGKPIKPEMFYNPAMSEIIRKQLIELQLNPVFKKGFDELIERKRKLWNDRESNRKLVD